MVRHGVKFTALHLSEGGVFSGTRFCVANSVALPLACTIFASKLRSVKCTRKDIGGIEMWRKKETDLKAVT